MKFNANITDELKCRHLACKILFKCKFTLFNKFIMNYSLHEYVEESKENAVTTSDVMKKRGVSNLNSVLLGKTVRKFLRM